MTAAVGEVVAAGVVTGVDGVAVAVTVAVAADVAVTVLVAPGLAVLATPQVAAVERGEQVGPMRTTSRRPCRPSPSGGPVHPRPPAVGGPVGMG
jgi:hypothetical protein